MRRLYKCFWPSIGDFHDKRCLIHVCMMPLHHYSNTGELHWLYFPFPGPGFMGAIWSILCCHFLIKASCEPIFVSIFVVDA